MTHYDKEKAEIGRERHDDEFIAGEEVKLDKALENGRQVGSIVSGAVSSEEECCLAEWDGELALLIWNKYV